eukprot:NODE_48_length_31852_cov_1.054168.p26 type:complete len:105 gc:universal NODE_48_length_31852_cov_1.054168:30892-30578(-)
MSLEAARPFLSLSPSSSPSNTFIFPKSAVPIPTITIDKGLPQASTIASIVSSISVNSPSVQINRIKYFSAPFPSCLHTLIILRIIGAQFYVNVYYRRTKEPDIH